MTIHVTLCYNTAERSPKKGEMKMKQLLKRTLALLLAVLTMATAVSAANKSGYSDVPEQHRAVQAI